MFVSGNPTLPSKTPPTLKFLLDFEKNIFENGEKSVKKRPFSTIFEEKKNKKKTYWPTLPNFFQTVTRNRHIFFLGLRKNNILDYFVEVLDSGRFQNYSAVHLVEEEDGVRIIGRDTVEFFRKVPRKFNLSLTHSMLGYKITDL